MQTISEEQIVIFLICVCAFMYWLNRQRDKLGRLPDLAVTTRKVSEVLKEFRADFSDDGLSKVDERHIQSKLKDFFETHFHHFQSQKPIGGVYAKLIDFDLGVERVGVEIKMAKSLYKKAEFDRLPNQIKGYQEKYSDGNLFLLVFCSEDEMKNRLKQTEIRKSLSDSDLIIQFLPIFY